MAVRLLYLFPSTTHPVTNGAQVRANALLRHFVSDLGWEVEFFCPAGSREPSSWGENAALLRAIDDFGPASVRATFWRYTARGWQVAREEECASCDYVRWVTEVWDSNAWPSPLPVEADRAAAARAVACVELTKGGR